MAMVLKALSTSCPHLESLDVFRIREWDEEEVTYPPSLMRLCVVKVSGLISL